MRSGDRDGVVTLATVTYTRMRRAMGRGCVLTCALALVICAPRSAMANADLEIARGGEILAQKCKSCHAIGRQDVSTHDKAPAFRVVVGRYPVEFLAEALAEGIMSGHPDMPQFVFQPDEIDAILAYLKSLETVTPLP